LKKYAYGPDRTLTVQIRVWSGTYTLYIIMTRNEIYKENIDENYIC